MEQPDSRSGGGTAGGHALEVTDTETLAVLNAILRHHIRNHLTVIRGRARWLGRTAGEDDATVETIVRRCDEMADTVEKIERITETVLDTPERDPDPLDLSTFVHEEFEDLGTMYDVAFEIDLPEHGPAVLADDLLSFVFRELIDNSVTHSTAAEPTVAVGIETDEAMAHLLVADDGPGLPAAVVPDPFAHSVRGPESSGDGLGLFLCQAIVSRYAGEIELTEVENGVTVRISLPLA